MEMSLNVPTVVFFLHLFSSMCSNFWHCITALSSTKFIHENCSVTYTKRKWQRPGRWKWQGLGRWFRQYSTCHANMRAWARFPGTQVKTRYSSGPCLYPQHWGLWTPGSLKDPISKDKVESNWEGRALCIYIHKHAYITHTHKMEIF